MIQYIITWTKEQNKYGQSQSQNSWIVVYNVINRAQWFAQNPIFVVQGTWRKSGWEPNIAENQCLKPLILKLSYHSITLNAYSLFFYQQDTF